MTAFFLRTRCSTRILSVVQREREREREREKERITFEKSRDWNWTGNREDRLISRAIIFQEKLASDFPVVDERNFYSSSENNRAMHSVSYAYFATPRSRSYVLSCEIRARVIEYFFSIRRYGDAFGRIRRTETRRACQRRVRIALFFFFIFFFFRSTRFPNRQDVHSRNN